MENGVRNFVRLGRVEFFLSLVSCWEVLSFGELMLLETVTL